MPNIWQMATPSEDRVPPPGESAPVIVAPLNVMRLASPQSAILSAIIFNAVVIIALIPLALRGVTEGFMADIRFSPVPEAGTEMLWVVLGLATFVRHLQMCRSAGTRSSGTHRPYL